MSYSSVFRDDLFKGQSIVVTGGGSGIGRCIAHELAHLGAHVILTGRNPEKLAAVAAEITEDGGSVDTQCFDIRDEKIVAENIAEILKRTGQVHALVNNAGGQFAALLENISQNGWEAVVRTNLTGGFLMAREMLNQCFKQHGGGNIVNITADNWHSMPHMGHSGAARAGMDNFTKTAALEWAHHGVRVNAVAPGIIASSGLDTYDEEHKKKIRARTKIMPTKRYGMEAEISAAVVFLLTPASAFTTGEVVSIDGGVPRMTINYQVPDHNKLPAWNGFHRAELPEVLKGIKMGGGDD